MAGVNTSVSVTDGMSAVFQTMTASINACLGTFIEMQSATSEGLSVTQIENMTACMVDMNAAAHQFNDSLNNAGNEQEELNNRLARGATHADGLLNRVIGIASAYASIQTLGKAVELSDTLTSTDARLSMIVDDGGSVEQLKADIMQSAKDARAAYLGTADAVAKMGMQAGAAFANNGELIEFTELLNKQFVIAGTSAQGVDSVMLQLTQAMSAGKLQGEELNAVLDNATPIVQNIKDYMEEVMGIDATNIKELASDGQITSEVIKNAMFYAADEINARFESMPLTFAQIGNDIQNEALEEFEPILRKLNEIANSDRFDGMVDGLINGLAWAADVATVVVDGLVTGAAFVYDNWSIIEPIFWGIVAAVGAYTVAQTINNAVTSGAAIAEGIRGAAMAFSSGATFSATAAQHGFNAALLACPITWIVIGIMAIIAAVYAGTAAFNKFSGESVSATGLIAGAFTTVGAHIVNTVLVPLQNQLASFANFLGNFCNDPVAAIKVLFYDMVLTVLGYIVNLAEGIETLINKIPGMEVDITTGMDNFYSSLEAAQQQVKDEAGWVEYVGKMDYINYEVAAQVGYQAGAKVESDISDFFDGDFGKFGLDDVTSEMDDLGEYSAVTADNTGAVADSLEVAEDNLAWMKDIAEREIIDRTVFRDIKVDMGGVNNIVNNNQDLDSIGQYLVDTLEEQMASSAEGV